MVLSAFGTPLAFLFGAYTPLMAVLFVMVCLDIFTGFAKAIYFQKLKSRTMSHGMIRKACLAIVVILCHMIDLALFNDIPVAKTGCILFYIGVEGLSILENLGEMKVPLPKFIHENLEVLKQKGEHTDS
ncbi:phage holin family protein [Priestia aryabhattai]|uniref:phage holin family protein n=1 Tax=Priestia aryabhattai TaxID=412384 RepID=UPI0005ED05D5|nr:phage holin family protein [Priestia aryabhattai]KJL04342.1 hypothetical protein N178_12485 [Priestia aryabhattai B8W22]